MILRQLFAQYLHKNDIFQLQNVLIACNYKVQNNLVTTTPQRQYQRGDKSHFATFTPISSADCMLHTTPGVAT